MLSVGGIIYWMERKPAPPYVPPPPLTVSDVYAEIVRIEAITNQAARTPPFSGKRVKVSGRVASVVKMEKPVTEKLTKHWFRLWLKPVGGEHPTQLKDPRLLNDSGELACDFGISLQASLAQREGDSVVVEGEFAEFKLGGLELGWVLDDCKVVNVP